MPDDRPTLVYSLRLVSSHVLPHVDDPFEGPIEEVDEGTLVEVEDEDAQAEACETDQFAPVVYTGDGLAIQHPQTDEIEPIDSIAYLGYDDFEWYTIGQDDRGTDPEDLISELDWEDTDDGSYPDAQEAVRRLEDAGFPEGDGPDVPALNSSHEDLDDWIRTVVYG